MGNTVIQEVIQFIRHNFNKELPLEKLANRAFLSPFHFQRVFKEAVGETPKQYITRIRLEEAAHQIALKPESTILSIAFDCGYNSLESFSRAFKKHYSISPDAFRKMTEEKKLEFIRNKTNKEMLGKDSISFINDSNQNSEPGNLSIEIERLPLRKFIYIPTTLDSTIQITKALKKVKQWAEIRDLATQDSELFGLFFDYPLFTALEKCRYLACFSLDKKPDPNGNI